MACIYGAASSVPKYNMNGATIHKLFQNKVFDYSEKTLQKLSGILQTCDFTSRPCCVDFGQFTDERVRGEVYPTAENLFSGAEIPFRPSLTDRAVVWEQAVKELAVEAALSVLAKTDTVLSDVECVITNTSTGVILPNLDTWLQHNLGLPNVKCHYPIDNTGCGGAITCLDIARSTVLSGRAKVVLIVTVDCCSPHMNTNGTVKLEGILPNLLFGDGAGAIVVGVPRPGTWLIDEPTGVLLGKDTQGDIDLKLGKDGYLLTLSRQLVQHLAAHLTQHWKVLLEGLQDPAQCEWLIHPGGRAILDVFRGLSPNLSDHDMRHSLSVMDDRGNLVSATLVFVLERMLAEHTHHTACLIGPGPGVEIKVMTLHKVK